MNTPVNFNHILLFKTNINCDKGRQMLQNLLDNRSDISCWSIDMEDSDYVLRIISETLSHTQIIKMINHHGYQCCELT